MKRYDNEGMAALVQQSDHNHAIAQTVDAVAQKIGCSSAQVALNWLRQQDIIPIIGARKLSRLQDNLRCIDFALSPEQMEKLNHNDFFQQEMPRQFMYGGMFDAINNHCYAPTSK